MGCHITFSMSQGIIICFVYIILPHTYSTIFQDCSCTNDYTELSSYVKLQENIVLTLWRIVKKVIGRILQTIYEINPCDIYNVIWQPDEKKCYVHESVQKSVLLSKKNIKLCVKERFCCTHSPACMMQIFSKWTLILHSYCH